MYPQNNMKMKKTSLIIIATVALFTACKKDTTSSTPTPSGKTGFVWKEDGGTEITADSAYWTSWGTGTGIRAFKGGNANFFEINWDGANNTGTGTKALPASMGFTFIKSAATYTNTGAEKINITAFSSDKLSGNFTVSVGGGSIKELSATFTDLPKR